MWLYFTAKQKTDVFWAISEKLSKRSNYIIYKLHPKGLCNISEPGDINMCNKCMSMSVKCGCQPKDSLANWHYTGYDKLPGPVCEAFESASVFDLMLVS
jgi:hypothetical protein